MSDPICFIINLPPERRSDRVHTHGQHSLCRGCWGLHDASLCSCRHGEKHFRVFGFNFFFVFFLNFLRAVMVGWERSQLLVSYFFIFSSTLHIHPSVPAVMVGSDTFRLLVSYFFFFNTLLFLYFFTFKPEYQNNWWVMASVIFCWELNKFGIYVIK